MLRFVEVFHNRDGVWTRVAAVGDDEAAQVMPPFDGAAIDIGAWWEALADEDAG